MLPVPGPVDPPIVSALHSRTATVNWTPPDPPNGIITNYSICVCRSSFCSSSSSSMAVRSSSETRPSLPVYDAATYMYPDQKLRSSVGSDGSFSTIQGTRLSLLSDPGSAVTEDTQIKSALRSTQSTGSVSSLSTETSAASVKTNHSPLSNTPVKRVSSHGPNSDCFTAASHSSSNLRSVIVPGSITTSTLLDLLPYQTYKLQVKVSPVHGNTLNKWLSTSAVSFQLCSLHINICLLPFKFTWLNI